MQASENFNWVQQGTQEMLDLWMYNFARNISDIIDGNNVQKFNTFQREKNSILEHNPENSAVVIGAGPSIKEKNHLQILANSNFHGNVICTDRMLVSCLENGITPERFPKFFVLTMDPYEITLKYYNHKIIEKFSSGISTIMSTCTMHETIELCRNKGLEIFWFHPLIDDFRKSNSINKIMNMMSKSDKNPKGFPGLQTGGNVGCFSWIFAWTVLGCSPIALIGLNMGYPGNTPLEKTQHYDQILNHFDGNKDKVGQRYRRIFNEDLKEEALLDPVFDFYREAFLDLSKRTPSWVKTINATEGGSLFGEKIENMQFNEFLKKYSK